MTEAEQLERTWYVPRGIVAWFSVADHRTIGKRYLVTAFGFFIVAGILAGLMRIQLAVPENRFLGPDLYNQIFSVHGTMMMFLFAVPVMDAMGIYLVPLMVGARNIAFPRLNTFSYFVYLFGGVMLVLTMLLNTAPDVGWFSYVPLAGPDFTPGKRTDFWAQLITFTEVAALAVAVELAATILKLRAPGMTLNRIPLFVWAILVASFMVIFAMPAVVTASSFLLTDRLVGTHFYNPAEGGDPLLFQHLFWFFGHPEVYIIFVPALGMVSSIIVAFTQRPIFGYTALVLSLIATGFIGFGLWVHHMFATGLPQLGLQYFTAASMPVGANRCCCEAEPTLYPTPAEACSGDTSGAPMGTGGSGETYSCTAARWLSAAVPSARPGTFIVQMCGSAPRATRALMAPTRPVRAAAIRAQNSGWARTAAITLESYHAAVDNYAGSRLVPAAARSTSAKIASRSPGSLRVANR